MALTLEGVARNAACDAVVDLLDGGAADGYVEIRTSGGTTLLVSIDFNDPAFGAAAAGVANVSVSPSAPSAAAVADGDAAVCRFYDSDDQLVMSGTVTATGGGGDITIADVTIASGATVTITGGNITMPAS